MEERDNENIYNIPANYTDSGKILGGLVSWRNAIETIILVLIFGFVELKLIPMPDMVKVVVMTVTLVPLAIFFAMGIDGDSLCQYLGRIFKHLIRRKQLHFKRVEKNEIETKIK